MLEQIATPAIMNRNELSSGTGVNRENLLLNEPVNSDSEVEQKREKTESVERQQLNSAVPSAAAGEAPNEALPPPPPPPPTAGENPFPASSAQPEIPRLAIPASPAKQNQKRKGGLFAAVTSQNNNSSSNRADNKRGAGGGEENDKSPHPSSKGHMRNGSSYRDFLPTLPTLPALPSLKKPTSQSGSTLLAPSAPPPVTAVTPLGSGTNTNNWETPTSGHPLLTPKYTKSVRTDLDTKNSEITQGSWNFSGMLIKRGSNRSNINMNLTNSSSHQHAHNNQQQQQHQEDQQQKESESGDNVNVVAGGESGDTVSTTTTRQQQSQRQQIPNSPKSPSNHYKVIGVERLRRNSKSNELNGGNDDEHSVVSASSRSMDPGSGHDIFDAAFGSSNNNNNRMNAAMYKPSAGGSLKEVSAEEPLDEEAKYTAMNFSMEHRIFLNAALALLAERDRHAPELGMRDPIILKSGSLKKASRLMNGVWKVKFVEIRRGMFSYYENAVTKDASGEDELRREDIPLEANSVSCRGVKLHQKALNFTPGGSIFELTVNGSKRLWMAKTRADRHLWMQTIQNAIVGGSVTRGNTITDHSGDLLNGSRSPFKVDLRKYIKAQTAIRHAKTKNDYIAAIRTICDHCLLVPIKWITKQGSGEGEAAENPNFREESVDRSVEQLWRDLQRDSVTINGENFRGDSGHGPEKIIGALVRAMLGVGHDDEDQDETTTPGVVRSDLPESQALSYARDILLSGNRTRSAGDSYFCVNTLCKNNDLVVIVPGTGEAEPVNIDVCEDESDLAFYSRVLEKTGWIKSRSKTQTKWRNLFFVLSDGTLSFYENALPRPHKLQGQMVLTDVAISITRLSQKGREGDVKMRPRFVLTLTKGEGVIRERLMLFDSVDRLLDWTYALECTLEIKALSERRTHRRRGSYTKDIVPETPNSRGEILSLADRATKEHVRHLGLDESTVENRLSLYARKKESAVLVSIRACTNYKVCTLDPQGIEDEDTWATIQSHFLQSFRIYGGPNGRIMRGEEIVRLQIKNSFHNPPETVDSSCEESPRRARTRLTFRTSSTVDEVPGLALAVSEEIKAPAGDAS